jgi:hypothetical protein
LRARPDCAKEAMTCNLPVVSTRFADGQDLVAPVDPSWVCDAKPDGLAAALVGCLTDRRRSNRPAYGAEFTLDAVAECILVQYRRARVGLEARRPNEPRKVAAER